MPVPIPATVYWRHYRSPHEKLVTTTAPSPISRRFLDPARYRFHSPISPPLVAWGSYPSSSMQGGPSSVQMWKLSIAEPPPPYQPKGRFGGCFRTTCPESSSSARIAPLLVHPTVCRPCLDGIVFQEVQSAYFGFLFPGVFSNRLRRTHRGGSYRKALFFEDRGRGVVGKGARLPPRPAPARREDRAEPVTTHQGAHVRCVRHRG